MKVFPSFEGSSSREELKKYLEENKLAFSFNRNPERFISKSITPTNLQNYLTCPHCFFESKKKTIKIPNQKENENIMVSNTIHFLLEYLFRNEDQFQKSLDVLNFIDFEEGNFLEFLKTDENNSNYDLLNYLADLEDEDTKEKIVKGVLIGYGTAKKLKFEEIRKIDSISLNLQNTINKGSTTIYAKPDLTGRHPTTNPKTLRKYDNFFLYLTSQAFTNPLYKVATLVFKKPASVDATVNNRFEYLLLNCICYFRLSGSQCSPHTKCCVVDSLLKP